MVGSFLNFCTILLSNFSYLFLISIMPEVSRSSNFVNRASKLLCKILKQVNDTMCTQNDVQTLAITVQCQNVLRDLGKSRQQITKVS